MATAISVLTFGLVEYTTAYRLQAAIAQARAAGRCGDTVLLLEHPPVITVGLGGGREDILASETRLREAGIRVIQADRGGRATYHGPGQLVIYPILKLGAGTIYEHVWRLEETAIRVVRRYGLAAARVAEHPGVWIHGRKIAATGVAVQDGITRHGLALNVAPNLDHFRLLIPCGLRDRGVTSIAQELGFAPPMQEVTDQAVEELAAVFGEAALAGQAGREGEGEQPAWLWRRVSAESEAAAGRMEELLRGLSLHTVCQQARCPNLAECFGQGTAALLILGDVCTRACRFCAAGRGHGRPAAPDPDEPDHVARAAAALRARHVVITSVTRDDLPDGGAAQFATTIHAVRARLPGATIEVLIPDLRGSLSALNAILEAGPEVLNHNVETVPRLYRGVRPGASYERSLAVLTWAKRRAPGRLTKSGLMLGLGERTAEVWAVLRDLRRAGCDMVTLGQYLQPTAHHIPVARYLSPGEFADYAENARTLGFRAVAAGPLVRSSHQAGALLSTAVHRERGQGAGKEPLVLLVPGSALKNS